MTKHLMEGGLREKYTDWRYCSLFFSWVWNLCQGARSHGNSIHCVWVSSMAMLRPWTLRGWVFSVHTEQKRKCLTPSLLSLSPVLGLQQKGFYRDNLWKDFQCVYIQHLFYNCGFYYTRVPISSNYLNKHWRSLEIQGGLERVGT